MKDSSGSTELDRLADLAGVERSYWDALGTHHVTSDDAKRAILTALGLDVSTPRAIDDAVHTVEERPWRHWVEPVRVERRNNALTRLPLSLPDSLAGRMLQWRMRLEDGATFAGSFRLDDLPREGVRQVAGRRMVRAWLTLPATLAEGYHHLTVTDGERGADGLVVIAPPRCWTPDWLARGDRRWGLNCHLYSVRSDGDWGIGDFGGLARVVDLGADLGADVIGVNPLHALYPDRPEHASPYSPSSRLFLNPLYVDVSAEPEFDPATDAPNGLAKVRAATHVDYTRVARIKDKVFARMFERLTGRRRQAFEDFRAAGGEPLRRFALFQALQNAQKGKSPPDWPQRYRSPDAPAVAQFERDHQDSIDFRIYLQWLAERQLGAAAETARKRGLRVGLYRDLAVGVDPGGADAWSDPALLVRDARFGAPPDAFTPLGQDWGMPPINPLVLRDRAYAPFVDMVRANMRHAGALRIDHAMGLQHIYWVPPGASPAEGAYVKNPFDDLLGILALESHRNRCLVVGEDLGTVPDSFRERMDREQILSYRVFQFERWPAGLFKRPDTYPRLALATATTHDLPTIAGRWRGHDVSLRERLGLFPDAAAAAREKEQRHGDNGQLVDALLDQTLLPEGFPRFGPLTPEQMRQLTLAVERFLARAPSALALLNLDDLLLEPEQLNLPGTVTEYPNWRRRLSQSVESMGRSQFIREVAKAVAGERRTP